MILILDYSAGNIQSVRKKVERLNQEVWVGNDPKLLEKASKIILPGVGHFGNAMEQLQNLAVLEVLNEQVLVKQKPILGICLGMQLMAKSSEEGNANGLGWVNGTVKRFSVDDTLKYKIPHMGWNTVNIKKNSQLMKNIEESSEFYFVHSYHFTTEDQSLILNTTDYHYSFVSAFENNNIFGVQYHPEKSHDTGMQLIQNFLNL